MRIAAVSVMLVMSVLLLGCGGQAPEQAAQPAESQAVEPVPVEELTGTSSEETTGEPVMTSEPEPAAPETPPQSVASESEPAAREGLPVLYDFWATWCPPCRQQKPIIEELKEEYAGVVDIIAVDVDEQGEMAKQYDIKVIPTLVMLDAGGSEVERLTGLTQKDKLVERFRAHGFIE
ncbi:MAG: thioredoxin family protein [bacterium]